MKEIKTTPERPDKKKVNKELLEIAKIVKEVQIKQQQIVRK